VVPRGQQDQGKQPQPDLGDDFNMDEDEPDIAGRQQPLGAKAARNRIAER
jgi:hypothetical protein